MVEIGVEVRDKQQQERRVSRCIPLLLTAALTHTSDYQFHRITYLSAGLPCLCQVISILCLVALCSSYVHLLFNLIPSLSLSESDKHTALASVLTWAAVFLLQNVFEGLIREHAVAVHVLWIDIKMPTKTKSGEFVILDFKRMSDVKDH